MNDLIDRQAALDIFKPWLDVKGYSEGELNMLRAVIYELETMPSTSAWVSVKDRLPEKSVPVLICAAGHRVTAYYDKVKEVFRLTEDDDLFYLTKCVTHWMPLPEPPESEGEICIVG